MQHETIGEKVFNIFNIIFLLLLVLIVVIPFMSVISSSLVSAKEFATKDYIIFPEVIDFTAYKTLLKGSSVIYDAFTVTMFRVIVGTTLNLLFTYLTAYAMAKKTLPGRNLITLYFFFTMLFAGGLIPYYIVVKSVGLTNNIWVYIIPGLISVWNTLLIRNFIMSIPDSLIESAEIDGANDLQNIFRIVLPLSLPALAAIGLFYAVEHWNNWFDAYLFVSDSSKQPLQLMLRNILISADVNMNMITGQMRGNEIVPPARSIQNAAVIITILPIVMVYPFIQKYFVKGIMVGAIKG